MARTVADPAADTPALSGVKRIRDVTGAIAPLARASMLREPIYDAEQDHLSALWRLFADDQKALRTLAFIVRCSCAATVAYQLALSLQLPNALWAAMSALIVSQERLHETRSSLAGRILGTLLAMGVTVAVNEAARRVGADMGVQIAVAVAICAGATRRDPRLRVAMWTCPLILLTTQASAPIGLVAFQRGCEVIFGAIVGWMFHGLAELIMDRLGKKRRVPRAEMQPGTRTSQSVPKLSR